MQMAGAAGHILAPSIADQSSIDAALIRINAGILILAALWLLVDLAQIDEAVAAGAPKSMEWLLAFGLIVTLAWVYLEAVKLAFRIAAMFGERK